MYLSCAIIFFASKKIKKKKIKDIKKINHICPKYR